MKFTIDYDPISFEFQVHSDKPNIVAGMDDFFKNCQNGTIRITDWFEDFIERVRRDTNEDTFSVDIVGCDEYEKSVIQELTVTAPSIQLEFTVTPAAQIEHQYKKIDDFLQFALKSDDPVVKKAIDKHRENINYLKSSVVEIPVCATYSSGKSTLLNALMGEDLLPARKDATTATTCEIRVNNKLAAFNAQVFSGDEVIKEAQGVSMEFVNEYNELANQHPEYRIVLEGPVRGIESKDFILSFVDTPGPNNKSNENHKEITYGFIKDHENLPIMLFVLDPENMESNDQYYYLDEIAKEMRQNRGSLERIVFILNKVDELDPENGGTIDRFLEKSRDFLAKFGIEHPKIFPVSAFFAYLIQKKERTRKEEGNYNNFKDQFTPTSEYPGLRLIEYSPLTETQKDDLRKRITGNDTNSFLVYSGLASIKVYIQEYISNHHRRRQYNELQKKGKAVIDSLKADIKLSKKLQEEFASEKKNIDQFELEIKQFREKRGRVAQAIKGLSTRENLLAEEFRQSDREINIILQDITNPDNFDLNDNCSRATAERLIKNANDRISNLTLSLKTSIVSEINDERIRVINILKEVAKREYQKESLVNQGSTVFSQFLNKTMLNSITGLSTSNLENIEHEENEERQVEVESKWWIKRVLNWTVTKKISVSITVYSKQDLYNLVTPYKNLINDEILDIQDQFRKEIRELVHSCVVRIDKFAQSSENELQAKLTAARSSKKSKQSQMTDTTQLQNIINSYSF